MEVVPYEKIERCPVKGDRIELADYSKFELVVESDYDFFINGTIKFLKEIKRPLKTFVVSERWHRDQWVTGIELKLDDICEAFENPSHMAHQFLKDQKNCPLSPGVS